MRFNYEVAVDFNRPGAEQLNDINEATNATTERDSAPQQLGQLEMTILMHIRKTPGVLQSRGLKYAIVMP